jgi:exopolysaccharide production protein ExoQ
MTGYRALRLLAVVWFGLMAASFIAGIVAPGFAVMREIHPGAWSGGWGEKNALGGHAARAAFLFAFPCVARRADHRAHGWIGLIVSLLLVLLSKSATALLGALAGPRVSSAQRGGC